MAVPRFFHLELRPGRVALSPEESDHARRSRRLRPGDPAILFDGRGRQAEGRLIASGPQVEIEIETIQRMDWAGPKLTLATAIPKGARQDALIEKCTELGVWAIWGVDFARSVVKATPARKTKWTRTAVEAAKQSGRSWLPEIDVPVRFDDLIAKSEAFDLKFVGDPHAEPLPTNPLAEPTILAVVGPEGGLTDAESAALRQAGCCPASWSRFVLRVETAAIAAAALLR